jgi:hypothetical protein
VLYPLGKVNLRGGQRSPSSCPQCSFVSRGQPPPQAQAWGGVCTVGSRSSSNAHLARLLKPFWHQPRFLMLAAVALLGSGVGTDGGQLRVPVCLCAGAHGGNQVECEGSFDNWTQRHMMLRSGKDFTLVKLLPPGVYQASAACCALQGRMRGIRGREDQRLVCAWFGICCYIPYDKVINIYNKFLCLYN